MEYWEKVPTLVYLYLASILLIRSMILMDVTAKMFQFFFLFYLCVCSCLFTPVFFPLVVFQDSTAPDMSFLFEWFYNGFNSVLQFLGEYGWSDTWTWSKQEFIIEGLKKISSGNLRMSISSVMTRRMLVVTATGLSHLMCTMKSGAKTVVHNGKLCS